MKIVYSNLRRSSPIMILTSVRGLLNRLRVLSITGIVNLLLEVLAMLLLYFLSFLVLIPLGLVVFTCIVFIPGMVILYSSLKGRK